jgi:transcriptional regulator with XRE-family HTH domain
VNARLKKGWTQTQLAHAAGTKQSRISELEGIRGNPTLDTIERVARALELTLVLQDHRALTSELTPRKPTTIQVYCLIGPFGPESRTDVDSFRKASSVHARDMRRHRQSYRPMVEA